jgi:hypothetical protein
LEASLGVWASSCANSSRSATAYARHEVFGGARAGLFAYAAYADSSATGRWAGAFEAPAGSHRCFAAHSPQKGQPFRVKSVRRREVFGPFVGCARPSWLVAEIGRKRLARLSLHGCGCGERVGLEPKVAQAMAGEAALRALPRRKPSGSQRAFGFPDDGRYLGSWKLGPFHAAQVETI